MIPVKCKCGEVYQADEAHIGRYIQCRKCERRVDIVAPKKARVPRKPKKPKKPTGARAAAARAGAPPGAGERPDGHGPLPKMVRYALMGITGVLLLVLAGLMMKVVSSRNSAPPPETASP